MKYYSRRSASVRLAQENEELKARLEKTVSDLDYVAMLTEVDLEEETPLTVSVGEDEDHE